MSEVKMYFDTDEELLKCLKKWKERLGLSDWLIACTLSDKEDMENDGEYECAGYSEVQWVSKTGSIQILKKEYIPDDCLFKQPHEESLIHELLHFKFLALEGKSREHIFYETMQHQMLEELARAFFLAEYNLPNDWYYKDDVKSIKTLEQLKGTRLVTSPYTLV